ncbi:MAG: murein DD-endopeptidase MepM/ murein hydrolase activator NlpD [Saprospiraceae bacterium]|jgi:murein DD-endopeptidase MepM/ murein hydrolase activator NlpD
MIHPPLVIARIVELLKLSGVTSDTNVEEMTDHYLTQIESDISNGSTEQTAIRETYQVIARTSLNAIEQKETEKGKWILGTIVITLLLLFIVTQCKNSKEVVNSTADIASIEIPDGWPINSDIDQITSGFGLRMNPISKSKRFHKGIDIKATKGTPVISTGNGKVIVAGYSPSSGNYILIKHNEQYSTRYDHLSKVDVVNSQSIIKGETIGLVGNYGISLAPNLHYEVIKNELVVDPMDVIAP